VYRIGYDDNHEIADYGASNWKTLATVWHDLMVPIVGGSAQRKTFTADSDVVLKSYCTETGYLATSSCPSTAMGYYKSDFLPRLCDSHHDGTYWTTHGDTSKPFYN
jgi:penicillin-binding protein 1A